jgi:hypothetical protein
VASAGNFPRILKAGAGDYCLDPHTPAQAYGDKAGSTLDVACAELFHGECELYKSYGLQRLVSIRYVDGSGAGGIVQVKLSRFASRDEAFAMYTRRVVPEDPADPYAPKPIEGAAGAAALGMIRAYVWRADEVAELEYINEHEPATERAATAASVLAPIARLLSLNIRGADEMPPSVTQLPTQHLVSPCAVTYFPKDALGVAGVGGGAVGYYREGNTRYRLVAIQTAGVDKAKQVMKAFAAIPGAAPFAGVGDEGIHVALQASPSAPQIGWWITRTKGLVAGAGDEELLLEPRDAAQETEPERLTAADAIEVLKAWISPHRPSTTPAKRR